MNRIFPRAAWFAAAFCTLLVFPPFKAIASDQPSPLVTGLPDRVAPEGFGINIHFSSPGPGELERFAQAGFGFARMDLIWTRIEKTKGVYDFSAFDALPDQLASHGTRLIFILAYSNPLYDHLSPHTPEGRAAFAAFAGAAAKHFANRGILWEIWNEPNSHTFWSPQPNADDYAALAIATARALHANDPSGTVLAPASSHLDWGFLEQTFRDGLLHEIDAVSVHPYRESNPETVNDEYTRLRRLIATYTAPGDPIRPIVCSEWGFSTQVPGGIPLDQQARYLTREWLGNLAQGVNLSIWYDWRNDGPNPANNENNFGTVARDLTPKPAFLAAQALSSALAGYRFVHNVPNADANGHELLFCKGQSVAVAQWSSDAAASSDAQTPAVRVVAPADADAGSLLRSAAFDYGSGILVATPEAPAALELTVTNPEQQPAHIQWNAGPLKGQINLKAGQSSQIPLKLPVTLVTEGHEAELPVSATWNGTAVIGLAPLRLQSAYHLELSAAPTSGGLALTVTGTGNQPFRGTVQVNAGVPVPLSLDALATKQINLPADATHANLVTVRDSAGQLAARLGPVTFTPIPGYPTAPGDSGSFGVFLYENGKRQQTLDVKAATTGAGAPAPVSIGIPMDGDPSWRATIIRPKAGTAIPPDANNAVLWVRSSGNGVPMVSDFSDGTTQVFQPNLPKLDWQGWLPVTIPLNGSELWHWGGAKDGVIHPPLTWVCLLQLDGNHLQTPAQGQIEVALPCYAIGQVCEPD